MTELISERLKSIVKNHRQNNHNYSYDEDRYWSLKEISEYTGFSIDTVRKTFICDPRWPAPLHSGYKKNSKQRWLSSEVKKALLLFHYR